MRQSCRLLIIKVLYNYGKELQNSLISERKYFVLNQKN